MCAIAGIFDLRKNDFSREIQEMCQQMILRGPDNVGTFCHNNVALGQCRLSIIDLESGNQPMFTPDGNVVIVFNGEIYNYIELKNELSNAYQFNTSSDTEVLLAGYVVWGIDKMLDKIEGMFAFCIYDINMQTAFLARDRFGEKPLYFVKEETSIRFASELKAFKPNLHKYSIDKTALNFYLALSYIPAPFTIYNEIKKLEASHYLKITQSGIEDIEYYNLLDHVQDLTKVSYDDAKQEIRKRVVDSIRTRLRSDVPVGAFLSGGIDSSIVCCTMHSLLNTSFDTFTIGFKQKEYDESDRAKIVADKINSNHHCAVLELDDMLGKIDDIIGYYDEPFADSSALPSYYVAKLAHEHVKMVLTGDSADEIFAGYERYLIHYYSDIYNKIPSFMKSIFEKAISKCPITSLTNNALRKIKKLIATSKEEPFTRFFNMLHRGFKDDVRKTLLKNDNYQSIKSYIEKKYNEWPTASILNKSQYCEMQYVLEGCMFAKVDRACMHNSLESRTPILDRSIVEYAFSIKPEYKMKGRNKKRIFKDAFKDILPDTTTKFSKRGFAVPLDYWFRNELKSELKKVLDKDFIEKQGLFNYELLHEMYQKHQKNQNNYYVELWNIYVFQKWYIKNFTSAN